MIVDAHCHAWAQWPYEPPVPDPESRGRVEQLLFEMDQNGVDRAVVICAGLERNRDNNRYIHEAVKRIPGRLIQFADVDSRWLPTHHARGAAARLREAVEAFGLVGFTHYLREDDDGSWLLSEEGDAFLRVAAEKNLIVSLACVPEQMPTVIRVAQRYPFPILCHHMARVRGDHLRGSGLDRILAAARHPTIFIKMSGFGYAAAKSDSFPYLGVGWVTRAIYEFFGPERLCWGSDYPVVRRHMTYAQSLEVARRHFSFMPEGELAMLLGGTMRRLLHERESAG
jgi:L-fuconolactonase